MAILSQLALFVSFNGGNLSSRLLGGPTDAPRLPQVAPFMSRNDVQASGEAEADAPDKWVRESNCS